MSLAATRRMIPFMAPTVFFTVGATCEYFTGRTKIVTYNNDKSIKSIEIKYSPEKAQGLKWGSLLATIAIISEGLS